MANLRRRLGRKTVKLRCMTFNTHIGMAVDGGVSWLSLRYPFTDVYLFQEIRSLESLKKALGPRYQVAPGTTLSEAKAGTYIAYKVNRFSLLGVTGLEDITFGGEHPRIRVQVHLMDKRSGRRIVCTPVHTQPLGKGLEGAGGIALKAHAAQTSAYAEAAARQPRDSRVVIDAGDYNEDIDHRWSVLIRPMSAPVKYSAVDMVGTAAIMHQPVFYDEAFVRTEAFVQVVGRMEIKVRDKKADHPAVKFVLKITKLNR